MLPLLALGFGATALNVGLSAFRRHRAKKGLENLKDNPISPYSASPELQQYHSQSLTESRNPRGVSAADQLAFNQNLSKQTNTLFNNAVSISGGNMAKSLRGALNTSSLGSINQFASYNAGLKRQNRESALSRLGMATNQMQMIRNRNEQANIDAQTAFGDAIRIQDENIGGAIESVGNLALTGFGYQLGGGKLPKMFSKKRNPTGLTSGAGVSSGTVSSQPPAVEFSTPTNYKWNWYN